MFLKCFLFFVDSLTPSWRAVAAINASTGSSPSDFAWVFINSRAINPIYCDLRTLSQGTFASGLNTPSS